jgi:DNA-directed RNA polymerase sigma subunit (sigma70/sigma32)
MDVQQKNIALYSQTPNTPALLIDRACEEIANDWSIIRALVGIRHHLRNKKNKGYQLAQKLSETEQFEPICKEIDKEVNQ